MSLAIGACPECGEAITPPGRFCEACGRDLSAPAVAPQPEGQRRGNGESVGAPEATGKHGPAGTVVICVKCGSSQISADDYCERCGWKAPSGRDHVELDLGGLAGVTDRGRRHHRNEDAMALAATGTPGGPAAIAVVCDGVSTSDRPDEASLAGAEAAARVLTDALRAGTDPARASARAIAAAADAVTKIADPVLPAEAAPAATYVSAVILGAAVTVCWAGDSRAYWLPADPSAAARLLTTDDSWAQELIANGVPEAEAQASPQAHQITRWLGLDGRTQDRSVISFEPAGDGVVLLCSDGLWNYRPEPAALAALALPTALTDPLAAAAGLVAFALEAGGQDNITVVLATYPRPADSQPE